MDAQLQQPETTALHMMTPQIVTIPAKNLVGKRLTMSLLHNTTGQLWGSFMPARRAIPNMLSADLISLQVYPPGYFDRFNLATLFEKWATVEVSGFDQIPAGMEQFYLPGGLYAVFDYKGPAIDKSIFQYIFTTWLPGSAYILDDRPHFEVLGEKYSNTAPDSEETIWIPIRPKQ